MNFSRLEQEVKLKTNNTATYLGITASIYPYFLETGVMYNYFPVEGGLVWFKQLEKQIYWAIQPNHDR